MKEIARNVLQFQRRDAGARARAVGGGGGMSSGGDGSDLEKRVSRLEAAFENVSVALTDIRSDIRLILGGGVTGGVLLIGAIIASHLILRDEIGRTASELRGEMRQMGSDIRGEAGATATGFQAQFAELRAKDDVIIERLGRLETTVAVLASRIEEQAPRRSGSPRASRGSADASAERETLH